MSYPPGPQDPYGQPQQQPQQYGYPPVQPQQQPYGYPQQNYAPNPGYPYPQAGMPMGPGPGVFNGVVELPYLGAVEVATMGRRFAARMLDSIVISLVMVIAMFAGLAGALGMHGTAEDGVSPAGGFGLVFGIMGIFSGFALLYEWLMIAFLGQTLGKMALALRVVRERDGQVPGLGSGFGRFIIPIVGFFLCYIGAALVYLSPFFDSTGRNRGWHDRAAGTIVVRH